MIRQILNKNILKEQNALIPSFYVSVLLPLEIAFSSMN